MIRRSPRSTLFPYTRSSDLVILNDGKTASDFSNAVVNPNEETGDWEISLTEKESGFVRKGNVIDIRDRKSTRLNSSHRCISYAVFCLKKKSRSRTNNSDTTE